jgi:hypothetical protein
VESGGSEGISGGCQIVLHKRVFELCVTPQCGFGGGKVPGKLRRRCSNTRFMPNPPVARASERLIAAARDRICGWCSPRRDRSR